MRKNSRRRNAFHPELNGAALEQRLVLAVAPGFTFVTPRQVAQLRAGVGDALSSTQFAVRRQIQDQARQLFANGTPTDQQIADFQANATGTILAGTSAVANMLAVLPHTRRTLVPRSARALIAGNQNSLLSRVQNIVNNIDENSSATSVNRAIAQNVRSAFGNVRTQTAQFFANENFNYAVLMANDGSQSLPQFIGDRIITQFASNLGNLALAFPTVGNSVLFANGATTASPAALEQFSQMVTPALGLTAFNLGTQLQLLPNGSSIIPQLQDSIFGTLTGTPGATPTTPASLFAALQALPTASTDFAGAIPDVFSKAFSRLTGILSPIVGTTPGPDFILFSTPTTGVFSSTFTGDTFQNGFLGGFGSGFTGFGTAPTTFNTNLGTGFNTFVSTANPTIGFITPPTTVSTGTGTGVVGTVGTTTA